MKKLTIILPVFNESKNLELAVETISKNVNSEFDLEFMIVDDGSTDDTWSVLQQLSREDHRIKALSLSRNFGKEYAIFAGIKKTSTDLAIIMDGDLQHPPEVIPELINKWYETNCDVVHGVKNGRGNESNSGSFIVKIFYWFYRISTGVSLNGASDFKLLNKRVLDKYSSLTERDLFFRGLIPWIGFKQEQVIYSVSKRASGATKWNPFKRFQTASQAITSFSPLPLQIVTIIGIVFLLSSMILGIYSIYQWWGGNAVEGFTTIVFLLLIIGATLMISLGIIGQYIARIFEEVKGRPTYIIKDEINL